MVFRTFDFHTIKSILNLKQYLQLGFEPPYFHTIKSILNYFRLEDKKTGEV